MKLTFKRNIKDINRFKQILAVFVEEGLGYYLKKSKLTSSLSFKQKVKPSIKINDKKQQAIRLRRSFTRLGPTFVKLGQLLSLRPDLVPIEYSEEFEKLQDQVPPFPYKKVKEIVEEELGKPLNKLFRSFDKKPVAAASIAQVHKAVLKNGKKVAVKVQRPDIKKKIDSDLDILFFIAHNLEKHFKKIKNYRPTDIIKEFAVWTRRELDFQIEAKNALRLNDILKKNRNIKIPKIYFNHSSKKVLTMEYIEGIKLNNLKEIKKHKINRQKIARTYFDSTLNQVLHEFFHADPHPANILVQKDGTLVYLDYGIVGELSPVDTKKIMKFLESIPEEDAKKSLDIIVSMAKKTNPDKLPAYKAKCLGLFEEVYYHTLQEKSFGNALYEALLIGTEYGIVFDANYTLMAKAIYQAEGMGLKIDPEFRIAEAFRRFAKVYIKEHYTPRKILERTTDQLWAHKDLILDLPDHIAKIVEHLEKDEEPERLNIQQFDELKREFEYISHRRSLALVASILVIGSIFLFYLEGRKDIFGLPLSILLFILAILFLIYFILHKKRGGA